MVSFHEGRSECNGESDQFGNQPVGEINIARPIQDPSANGDDDRLFEVVCGVRVEKTMGLLQNVIAGIL